MKDYNTGYKRVLTYAGLVIKTAADQPIEYDSSGNQRVGYNIQAAPSGYNYGTLAKREGDSYLGTAIGNEVGLSGLGAGIIGGSVASTLGSGPIPVAAKSVINSPAQVVDDVASYWNRAGMSGAVTDAFNHFVRGMETDTPDLRGGLNLAGQSITEGMKQLKLKEIAKAGTKGALGGAAAGIGLKALYNTGQYGFGHVMGNRGERAEAQREYAKQQALQAKEERRAQKQNRKIEAQGGDID